jgi:hypothetical protein
MVILAVSQFLRQNAGESSGGLNLLKKSRMSLHSWGSASFRKHVEKV